MKLTVIALLNLFVAAVSAHEVSRTDASCAELRESIHACIGKDGLARIVSRKTPCKRTDMYALHWTDGGPVHVFWKKDGGFEK